MSRRISFDLDDTLICYRDHVPCEPLLLPRWMRFLFREPLRAGTKWLFAELQNAGWKVCIYTTSYRRPLRVRLWLLAHGIRVERIINQAHYERQSARSRSGATWRPTKDPRLFGIDLHVDDSEGLRREGERAGFPVIVVLPQDYDWAAHVLQSVSNHS